MLKIAILTGRENGSPRVLAETLNPFIRTTGNSSRIFYRVKALKRLYTSKIVKTNRFTWFFFKIVNYLGDQFLFMKLKKKDAVIICACSPYGFYKDSYDISCLKRKINKPILYYAVQYLENSPTIIEKLKAGGHSLTEKYDWHLTVSPITELRGNPSPPWSQIGMYLRSSGLKPEPKKEFLAIVDFLRPGYEHYREIQISALKELNIKYISLEKEYSLEEIRKLYKRASIFFIQFPEAYGLPIAECLVCGSYIGTPDSSWPMAWRLDHNPAVHGPGILPECFCVYSDVENLKTQLKEITWKYNLEKTPMEVFNTFYKHYSSFYDGNPEQLSDVLKRISEHKLQHNK